MCYFQRDPPVEVHDLFTDIQDGRILMALLEELSGCKLVRLKLHKEKSHQEEKNFKEFASGLFQLSSLAVHHICVPLGPT